MDAIRVCLVLFIGWAAAGLAHAQGTMSGMNNSMPDGQLMAPAGQGQGPHDNGIHPRRRQSGSRARAAKILPIRAAG